MKAPLSDKIVSIYEEPIGRDYDRRKLLISDNTDIMGNFESEKNFDIFKARSWYSFRKEKLLGVKTKYSNMDFSKSVGLHLRLGDKQKEPYTKGIYFIPRIQYYIDALEAIKNYENILIFSDDIPASREYFNSITHHSVVYMEDNADWEDLYLMTQCHDFIC
ncbi:MAG: alpha-1,2-fucosyltransferase [bacterium]